MKILLSAVLLCVAFPTLTACAISSLGPLNTAARYGDIETVRLLVEKGENVNGVTRDFSPLFLASCSGQDGIVEYLLAKGADPNTPQDRENTALGCASLYGHQQIAKALINAGARVNNPASQWRVTALMWAAERGHINLVKLLLESGADSNQVDEANCLCWQFAQYPNCQQRQFASSSCLCWQFGYCANAGRGKCQSLSKNFRSSDPRQICSSRRYSSENRQP